MQLVLTSAMALLAWFCCFSEPSMFMLKGVVLQGPTWEPQEATLQPLLSPPEEMRDTPRKKGWGGSELNA